MEGQLTQITSARVAPERQLSVALVCMPFFLAVRPSIQIGLLHAHLERAGFHVTSLQLNLELAALLGPSVYDALCTHRRRMTGEWLFGRAAFGDDAGDDEAYLRAFPEEVRWAEDNIGLSAADLLALRRERLPMWIETCARVIDWPGFDVVGFSSTFQQNVASLALARRIKERSPRTRTVFGGANFEGEMGPAQVRAFAPIIDYAVVGEADAALPALLRAIAGGVSPAGIRGVVWHDAEGVHHDGQTDPVSDLDSLPVPRYDDYFERASRLGLLDDKDYAWAIPFETSRGCWWGKKHHCTFCGLNGQGMTFRAKRPETVLAELAELSQRHGLTFFEATDNILDMGYIEELFGRLRGARLDYQFFYEIKANVTPAQLKMLHRGGVRWIQPGIESLSTNVLRLMRKGATMLQNVRLLKWARYYGIRVSWNLLWGFPGETPRDYDDELDVLRAITHLEPPGGCGRIWLERFSPYFLDQARWGVRNVRPEASYGYAYPPAVELDKIAYFFDYEMEATLPDADHRATGEHVKAWREAWSQQPHSLTYRRTSDRLFIDENRGVGRCGTHTLTGPVAELYEYCSESIRTVEDATHHLATQGHAVTVQQVADVLEQLRQRALCVGEGGKYLSVAIPVHPDW